MLDTRKIILNTGFMLRNKAHYIIYILLVCLAIFISIYPDLYRASIAPSHTIYPFIHNHREDYYYYLSFMRQGLEGNILLTSRMTPEKFPPVFAQTLFAVLGHISRITNLSLVMVYFYSRIVFGIFLLFAALILVFRLFEKTPERITASLFAFFSTGFWTVSFSEKGIIINQFLSFWTRVNPILRTTFLPHHLLSTALAIFSIVILMSAIQKSSAKLLFFSSLLGMISGLVYFAMMINMLGGLGLFFVYSLIKDGFNKSISKKYQTLIFLSFYAIVSLFSFYYLYYLSKTVFPWSIYDKAAEKYSFYIPLIDYVGSLGPTFFLTLIGIPRILQTKSNIPKMLLFWALFPFLGIFILNRIIPRVANSFYLESANYIPLGILSVYGIRNIQLYVKRIKPIPFLVVFLLILYFLPPLVYSVSFESKTLSSFYYNDYIPKNVIDGINWLQKNTLRESIVLAGGHFGNIIPAFSHNRVVSGHRDSTYNLEEKIAAQNIFFYKKDKQGAKEVLNVYKVDYVFYSLDTDRPTQEFIDYVNIKEVYTNPNVAIYKTQ